MAPPLLPLVLLALPQASAPPFVARNLPGVTTTAGSAEKEYILEVNGSGLAAGDFDGDGAPDLVVADGSSLERLRAGEPGLPARLFLNDGKGELAPAGEAWALPAGRFGTGLAAGDVDADGHLDLALLQWGADLLVRNRDGQGFERVEDPGFRGKRWATSGAFHDGDLDGDLDLYVVNYLAFDPERVSARSEGHCRWKGQPVMCGPEGLTPVHDQYYRNDGRGGFEEVSARVGLRPETAGFGLGITTLDFDLDGDTDLYVTNDSTPNHLWRNEGGTFAEIGLRSGVALDGAGKEQAGMGITVGDWNADGVPDLFATNFSGEENAFYLSSRAGRWRERASASGLGGPSKVTLGWGTATEDFDLDGDLDLVVFNGHVYPQADAAGTDTSYAQADALFENLGGRFVRRRLSAEAPGVSRAALAADFDRDGRPDLVASELGGPVRLLRNAFPREGRSWATFSLRGRSANLQGLGARVVVELADGSRLSREVRTAGGYQTSVPAEVHFGFGEDLVTLPLVRVHWPSGRVSEHRDLVADRFHRLVEPRKEAPR